MGLVHYGILNTNPKVEITCICDTQKLLLDVFSKENNNIKCYTDYKTLFNNQELDFVVISTPAKYHYDIIKSGINKNVNIFVEKPFVINVNEGEKLLEMIGDNYKNIYQVGFVNRYNEIFNKLKSILDDSILGDLHNFDICMFGDIIKKNKIFLESWRSNKKIAGGGCLMEFAIHSIDLLIWYFGMPEIIGKPIFKNIYSKSVEDSCNIILKTKDEIIGTFNCSWCDPTFRLPTTKIQINGDNGKLIAQEHEIKLFLINGIGEFNKGWNSIYLPDVAKTVRFDLAGSAFTFQLDDFIDSIINKKYEHCNSFRAAQYSNILIEECYNKGLYV